MEKSIVHKIYRLGVLLLSFGLLTGVVRADTFHLTDGSSVTGEIVSMDDKGVILKQADGSYADRLSWARVSQADLKDLDQNNPKAAAFVEPFIEITQDDKAQRTAIEVKEVPHFGRPTGHSLLGAMFTSSTGLFALLLVYAANLYAAYEVSIFRAQPAGLVCGVSAVAPFIGPIIFLAMPSKLKARQADWNVPTEQHVEPAIAAAIAAEQEVPVEPAAPGAAPAADGAPVPAAAPKPSLPPAKIFLRGQFTFNRRFFETQLGAYLVMTRPEAEKDKILTVRSNRGTFIAQRISRLSANDLQLQVQKGPGFEDIALPFVEIQEVQIKHRDA